MQKKTSKKNIDASLFFKRILLIGLAVYILVSLVSQQAKLSRYNLEEKNLNIEISQQEKLAKEMEHEKLLAGTDEYIERVARDRLGYTKKNEKVFIDINK